VTATDDAWTLVTFLLRRDEHGYPRQTTEHMWAKRLDDGTLELGNIPMYAFDVSLGDVIATRTEGDDLMFDRVVRRGGHATLRVSMRLAVEGTAVLAPLRRLGCTVNPTRLPDLFTIDVPPETDYARVVGALAQKAEDGWWEFEEAAVTDPSASKHRAALFPNPITALRARDRRGFLAQSRLDHLKVQPRLGELEQRLLQLGGNGLVFRLEPDLDVLLSRGEPIGGPKLLIPGRPSDCHRNVSRLWRATPGRTRIVTGWSLVSDDQLWRQHSWLLRRNVIVETTTRRRRYFGVVFSDDENERFASANLV
jgi:hypothetical protein